MSSRFSPDRCSLFSPSVDFFQSGKILIIFLHTLLGAVIFHRILNISQHRIHDQHAQISDYDINPHCDQVDLIHIIHKIFTEIRSNSGKQQHITDGYQKEIFDQCKTNIISMLTKGAPGSVAAMLKAVSR